MRKIPTIYSRLSSKYLVFFVSQPPWSWDQSLKTPHPTTKLYSERPLGCLILTVNLAGLRIPQENTPTGWSEYISRDV